MDDGRNDRLRRVVWAVATLLGLAVVLVLWVPGQRAYHCFADWTSGQMAEAEIVSVEAATGIELRFEDGELCLAPFGVSSIDEFAAGDRIEAVRRADRPGICETRATIEAARSLLVSVAAGVVCILLAIGLMARVIARSLTQVPQLTTRFELPEETEGTAACPRCTKPMDEGYLPLRAAIHWRRLGAPVGAAGAFGGLRGTMSLRKPPRVHAFRCEPCEVVMFRYGA